MVYSYWNPKQFNIANFNFKIVELTLYSNQKNNQNTIVTFALLIDDQNFIHDFKIQFQALQITPITTQSHEQSKKDTIILEKRKEFVTLCNLKHEFGSEKSVRNKPYVQIDNATLEKLNNKIINWKCFFEINTYHNVEYLITGSNSLGEDKKHAGFFKTKNNLKVGFLLKGLMLWNQLNKKKLLNSKFCYDSIWEKSQNYSKISFEQWIEQQPEIKQYLIEFNENSQNWKTTLKQFKTFVQDEKLAWKQLDNEINFLRKKQKDLIKKQYKNIIENENTYLILKFFEPGVKNKLWDHAHIKPVAQIKKEYLKIGNKKILEQISDPNNFLPLTVGIHRLFDKKQIAWKNNGKIQMINKKWKDDSDTESEVNKFATIKSETLEPRKKYIEEYYNNLIKKTN